MVRMVKILSARRLQGIAQTDSFGPFADVLSIRKRAEHLGLTRSPLPTHPLSSVDQNESSIGHPSKPTVNSEHHPRRAGLLLPGRGRLDTSDYFEQTSSGP